MKRKIKFMKRTSKHFGNADYSQSHISDSGQDTESVISTFGDVDFGHQSYSDSDALQGFSYNAQLGNQSQMGAEPWNAFTRKGTADDYSPQDESDYPYGDDSSDVAQTAPIDVTDSTVVAMSDEMHTSILTLAHQLADKDLS